MSNRFLVALAFCLALLAFSGPSARAVAQADSPKRSNPASPMASLDRAFGKRGLVTIPRQALGLGVDGTATRNGKLIVSGGSDLRFLSESGRATEAFGSARTLSPQPAAGGEFRLGGFTLDRDGRLLIVGTSEFPRNEAEVPRGPNGKPLPIVPSALRVIRILPNGRPDRSFGDDGVVESDLGLAPPLGEDGQVLQAEASLEATGITVDRQGRIVVTGGADIGIGPSCTHDLFEPVAVSAAFVARLTRSGAMDASFGRGGVFGGRKLGENPLRAESVGEPVVGPNGEITYRSTAISACSKDHSRWGIAQLTSSGSTRKTLGVRRAVYGSFQALAAEPNGSIVALASLPQTGREAFRARLIRITRNGKLDSSFGHKGQTIIKLGSSLGSELNAVAVDSKGRILVGGTLATRGGLSMLLVRLSADGRQEMSFGPNGRVATSYPNLTLFGPSDLFLDPKGRVVTVHRYEAKSSGLVLARYLLRN